MNEKIRETIASYSHVRDRWTTDLAFRSPEITPSESIESVFFGSGDNRVPELVRGWKAVVEWVQRKRRVAMERHDEGAILSDLVREVPGYLLRVDLVSVTWDGIASQITSDFFGVDDCPPWDFWVDWTESVKETGRVHLIAWIPQEINERLGDFDYMDDLAAKWVQRDDDHLVGITDILREYPCLCRR